VEREDGAGPGVSPAQPISHLQGLQAARQAIAEGSASSQHILQLEEKTGIGLHGINLHHLPSSKVLACMFLHLTFPDYKVALKN